MGGGGKVEARLYSNEYAHMHLHVSATFSTHAYKCIKMYISTYKFPKFIKICIFRIFFRRKTGKIYEFTLSHIGGKNKQH